MASDFRGNASLADKRNNKECAPVMFLEGQCVAVEEASFRRQELCELGAWDRRCLFFGGRESHKGTL